MSDPDRDEAEITDAAEAMLKEGQGLWRYEIVGRGQGSKIFEAGLNGDLMAQNMVRSMHLVLEEIRNPKRSSALMCFLCDHSFQPSDNQPGAFCFLTAGVDKPSQALCNAICETCAQQDSKALKERTVAMLRDVLIAEARILDIHEAGGRA